MTTREILTDAIQYWENRRIAYNLILAIIVIAVFIAQLPGSWSSLSAEMVQSGYLLAVLANVAYCAAYIVDIVVQHSEFQAAWKRYRWTLFAIGVLFAGIVTRFITMGTFGHAA